LRFLSLIPAKAGIQLFQDVLDPGACPGPDPGFAGVTLQETFYEIINVAKGEKNEYFYVKKKRVVFLFGGGDGSDPRFVFGHDIVCGNAQGN
jgi:hypothetical protein